MWHWKKTSVALAMLQKLVRAAPMPLDLPACEGEQEVDEDWPE